MTPDHKVLTTEGWKDASSCEKYQRADCRIPEGYETDWERLRVESIGDVDHTARGTSPVYDLTNCGPRNRFTIATPTGPLIVHNCENATQAMARDVFADALLRVHDSGVGRIVWHVHDEVIVEVPVDRAQAASDEVRRLMCVPPDWCPTLPLDAESSISSHYCK